MARPTAPANMIRLISSFELHLQAEGTAAGTVVMYRDAAHRLAGWLHEQATKSDPEFEWSCTWPGVKAEHVERFMVWMLACYSKGYANNQFRSLQQFFKWLAVEEDIPNPMTRLKQPKIGKRVVPVFTDDELKALIKDCEKGRDFRSRRDAAIMRLFACTGARLSELAGLSLDSVHLAGRKAQIIGKGDKERFIKFDFKCAQAIDRYLRKRDEHKLAGRPELWLSASNRGGLTGNGIYQMIKKRGQRLAIDIFPHKFRHNFSHRWLDAGGAEGDLMELNGWSSPQMVRHYGASARSARAGRAYDRVNVMGDI